LDVARVFNVVVSPAAQPRITSTVVGRERELAQLLDHADRAIAAPMAAIVRGASGVGKSALLRVCIAELRARAALVLEGRCYEHEHVPYKAVDKMVANFAAEASRCPPWLARVLPHDRVALVHAFPVLREIEELRSLAETSADDPIARQRRALAALTE